MQVRQVREGRRNRRTVAMIKVYSADEGSHLYHITDEGGPTVAKRYVLFNKGF